MSALDKHIEEGNARWTGLWGDLRAGPFNTNCMAQWWGPNGEAAGRSPLDEQEFGLMLGAVPDLYLTASVLILLDTSYLHGSRFWVTRNAARATDVS